MITEIKVFFPEVEHYLLKQFTTKQQVQYSKKSDEWVPREIQMFPLNIILHGWPLPADPTFTGLQTGGISPPSARLHAYKKIRKRDRTLVGPIHTR